MVCLFQFQNLEKTEKSLYELINETQTRISKTNQKHGSIFAGASKLCQASAES